MSSSQRGTSDPRSDCLCKGEGALAKNFAIDGPGVPELVPCPFCIEHDKLFYGNVFIQNGRRIDPTTVGPA